MTNGFPPLSAHRPAHGSGRNLSTPPLGRAPAGPGPAPPQPLQPPPAAQPPPPPPPPPPKALAARPLPRGGFRACNLAARPTNLEAALAQRSGTLAPAPCTACARGGGPFTTCVVVTSYLNGSCSNCHYSSEGARCSLRTCCRRAAASTTSTTSTAQPRRPSRASRLAALFSEVAAIFNKEEDNEKEEE
ncbi:hypothetical protein K469DRAFT_798433 [Zopfia rhizophila CBS 207.26]|uniref:Uncharacterized protein n=1 Tax=Zopfia rhizophila CBS 207.26 TaxID=1314779 RepID=A0A6A6DMS0_9PEZI|nr:hypothetical protein K469DRAFT_798433 [Zopfia rhizophila CBS 207.26]